MLFLRIVGVLYIVFGIWCTLLPQQTSLAVGFELASGSGLSEYITVYGGLEVGIGLAMIITSFVRRLQLGGLAFAFIFSVCLPLFRMPTLMLFDIQPVTYFLLGVEVLFSALLGWALWRTLHRIS